MGRERDAADGAGQKIDLILVDAKSEKIEAANAVKSVVINAVKGGKFVYVGTATP